MLNAKSMTSGTLTIIGKLGGDMFKDMKIPVENNLEEIVAELERLGYTIDERFHIGTQSKSVLTWDDGSFEWYRTSMDNLFGCIDITLAELKEM